MRFQRRRRKGSGEGSVSSPKGRRMKCSESCDGARRELSTAVPLASLPEHSPHGVWRALRSLGRAFCASMECRMGLPWRTSGLRICLLVQRTWVQSLVGKLRPYMLQGN